ncbi:MAG: type IX secretion system sortase PorU [Flavobacterium sp.]
MKKIIFLVFICFFTTSWSQNKVDINVNWTATSPYLIGSYSIKIPQFKAPEFSFDDGNKSIIYTSFTPSSRPIEESSLIISDLVTAPISVGELGELNRNNIPNSINATLSNVVAREKYNTVFSFSPLIKQNDTYYKVVSLRYTFAYSNKRLATAPSDFTSVYNSVLASGDFYRFYITKSGVYKISRDFLQQLGINTSGLDPRKIQVYGNGGRMIPLINNVSYPADLTENAVQVVGEEDGLFDSSDYILFYGEGVDTWNNESQTSTNLYADKSYYYIKVGAENGKRIGPLVETDVPSNLIINEFDDYQYHEVDRVNIARLGRRWFGEEFQVNNQQSFNFSFPNVVVGSNSSLKVYTAAASGNFTSFRVEANGQQVGNISIGPIGSYTEAVEGVLNTTFPASENVNISLTYNNNGAPSADGYLDYIILKSKRKLLPTGKQFAFQYDAASTSSGVGTYQFQDATGISQVWDITNLYDVTQKNTNSSAAFSFNQNMGEIRKYTTVVLTDTYVPRLDSETKIANQNLKGTLFLDSQGQFKDIDYLIFTPKLFLQQAEKLAQFHRSYSQLNVKVITLESIYPEFSSGKQDIGAIRNLVKYVYFNASSPDKRVKYVNLFGDASYDFKNRISKFSNFVPIYHSLNSYTLGESSFASDDYFGMMDPTEGNVDGSSRGLDIAVGRMIANSTKQADELVTKVIDYHDVKSYGNWRNNFVVIADDSDVVQDASLQTRMNNLADTLVNEKPFLNAKKILLDAYVQETASGGSRYPKAREDFFNAFGKGALVFNFIGHGGEDGLTQERVWDKTDSQSLTNKYKYPLFITITCQFSRFDNPFRPTAGEYTYWNPIGGAISMITTIREIGQITGETFNDILPKYLFSYGSNQYTSIAEALRLAKNDPQAQATRVVFYLGDPALFLAIPKPKIQLTQVNGVPISGTIDDLKSLAYVKLTGEVVDENNAVQSNYNGTLAVQIFDKEIIRSTFNNDGNSPVINFKTLGETIFRGNATVSNGQFEFGFVVPRDISIPLGDGRISFYSKKENTYLDNSGSNTTVKIGGINSNAADDNIPPQVKLYMNDQSFVDGGITNTSPLFMAYLEDENGINTAGGIGHDIVAILDGNESNPYKLNDYYETELDDYKKGKVKFPFRNLPPGLHTITFKAWDVYNNLVTSELQFMVTSNESITLTNVLNYPNPFVNYTEFWFTHNRPFEPLEVQVQVITITGKIVWTKNQTITTEGFLSREINWDGRDDFGDRIGKGVYIYKLTVKSTLTGSKIEKYEKLVIL